jgi:hypothetical protein
MRPFAVAGRPLFLPTSSQIHEKRVVMVCRVIVNADGEQCGHRFYEDESQSKIEAHVVECSARHASAIHAYRQRTHPDIMRAWDPELEQYVAEHREELIRGDLRMPHG